MISIKNGEVMFAGDAAEKMKDIDTVISMMNSESFSSLYKIMIIINGVIEGKIKKNCWNRAAEAVESLTKGGTKASEVIATWEKADHQLEILRKFGGGKQS